MILVKALEALLCLQVGEQRRLVLAVDLYFLELGKLSTKIQGAELMNFLLGAGSLLTKLVAGEVENLKTLVLILLVQGLQLFVLRSETATGGRVDNEQHLALVLG